MEIEELPMLLTSYTPCFRKKQEVQGEIQEGLIRQHQFDKVGEMVQSLHKNNQMKYLKKW